MGRVGDGVRIEVRWWQGLLRVGKAGKSGFFGRKAGVAVRLPMLGKVEGGLRVDLWPERGKMSPSLVAQELRTFRGVQHRTASLPEEKFTHEVNAIQIDSCVLDV